MTPRILLSLGHSLLDASSGSARSMRTICEMLAAEGFAVSALATTAAEHQANDRELKHLESLGFSRTDGPSGCQVLCGSFRSVQYTILDVGDRGMSSWETQFGQQFEELFRVAMEARPDVLLTYGGSPGDRLRRKLARAQGCKVVFGLRNLGYLVPHALDETDARLVSTQFVASRYREAVGVSCDVLPLPMHAEDVVAPKHDPQFLTFINPTHDKGVMFFARLAEVLAGRRPEIPLRVVESRGVGNDLLAAGLAGGFDLRKHPNLKVILNTSRPSEVYARTRVLVVPSLWEEPAGRVPVEAMMNGIPPIVSDRGGLPEVCRGGAFVLKMPPHLRPMPPGPVKPEEVEDWVRLIERLWDDEAFYQQARRRALDAAEFYQAGRVAQEYAAFFRRVIDAR